MHFWYLFIYLLIYPCRFDISCHLPSNASRQLLCILIVAGKIEENHYTGRQWLELRSFLGLILKMEMNKGKKKEKKTLKNEVVILCPWGWTLRQKEPLKREKKDSKSVRDNESLCEVTCSIWSSWTICWLFCSRISAQPCYFCVLLFPKDTLFFRSTWGFAWTQQEVNFICYWMSFKYFKCRD